jgi:hypothetical protein
MMVLQAYFTNENRLDPGVETERIMDFIRETVANEIQTIDWVTQMGGMPISTICPN